MSVCSLVRDGAGVMDGKLFTLFVLFGTVNSGQMLRNHTLKRVEYSVAATGYIDACAVCQFSLEPN